MRISSLGNGLTMLERQYDVKDAEPKKQPSEAAIKESMRQRTLEELKKGNPAKWYELFRAGKLDTYGKDEDLIDENPPTKPSGSYVTTVFGDKTKALQELNTARGLGYTVKLWKEVREGRWSAYGGRNGTYIPKEVLYYVKQA